MKPESAVRALNRRIKEIGEYFGKQSIEYGAVRSALYDVFGESSEYILTRDKKKSKFMSISKKLLYVEIIQEKVIEAWEEVKLIGTVKQLTERFIEPGVNYKNKDVVEYIRMQTRTEYYEQFVDTDYYEQWQDEIADESNMEDAEYYQELKDIKNIFYEKGNREEKWERVRQKFINAQIEHATKKQSEVEQSDEEPHDAGSNDYRMEV